MTTQLDPYETALLTELRTSSSRSARAPRRSRRRSHVRRPRRAAAAGIAVVLVLPGTGAQPAYAVTDRRRRRRARPRALAARTPTGWSRRSPPRASPPTSLYLPDDTECAPGRYDDAPDADR